MDADSSTTPLNLGSVFQRSYTCQGGDGTCARNNIAFSISEDTPTEVEVSELGSGVSISLYSDSLCANEISSSSTSTVDLSSSPLGDYDIYYKTSDNPVCSKNSFAFSRRLTRSTKGDRISAGDEHTCAVDNRWKGLLLGKRVVMDNWVMVQMLIKTTPLAFVGSINQISLGGEHTLALLSPMEEFRAGGKGSSGQLGDDTT